MKDRLSIIKHRWEDEPGYEDTYAFETDVDWMIMEIDRLRMKNEKLEKEIKAKGVGFE